MVSLCDFHFSSVSNVDGNQEIIEFDAKGYRKEENENIIYYFKHDNNYKFIIKKDILYVEVNDSRYVFDKNKITASFINVMGNSISVNIETKLLNILDNKIQLEYEMIFDTFKGKYHITLELY